MGHTLCWLFGLLLISSQGFLTPRAQEDETSPPVLAGYDLVAYQSLGLDDVGIRGNGTISYRYDSYVYYFSSEENKKLFMEQPQKYLPAFGGFDAWGLAYELPEDGWPWSRRHLGPACDPRHGWLVYRGVLYCSHSPGRKWDLAFQLNSTLELASKRWEQFYGAESLNRERDHTPMNNGCYSWNWQSCYERSILIPGLDQNRSELVMFEDDAKSWTNTLDVDDSITFAWTLRNISTVDPTLLVSINTTLDSDSEYIAFGVAEILMEGVLIVCSPAFRTMNSAECRAFTGEGMRIEEVDNDEISLQLQDAVYDLDTSEYRVGFSCSLYKLWGTPRLPARLIFARGPVADNSPTGHTMNDTWVVESLNLLSVVDQVLPPITPPKRAVARSLPNRGQWRTLGNGSVTVLDDRVSVSFEFFRAQNELIIEATMEADAEPGTYVAFGVAPESMSGLIVSCTAKESLQAECGQWRGEQHNLRPLNPYFDPGGWIHTNIASHKNGSRISYSVAAYVSDLVALPDNFDLNQLRGITAIGISADSSTPLQHQPNDATSFFLVTEAQSSASLRFISTIITSTISCTFVMSTIIL